MTSETKDEMLLCWNVTSKLNPCNKGHLGGWGYANSEGSIRCMLLAFITLLLGIGLKAKRIGYDPQTDEIINSVLFELETSSYYVSLVVFVNPLAKFRHSAMLARNLAKLDPTIIVKNQPTKQVKVTNMGDVSLSTFFKNKSC